MEDIRRRLSELERREDHRSEAHHKLANDVQRLAITHGNEIKAIQERQNTNTSRVDRIERFILGVLVVIALAFLGSLFVLVGWKP